MRAAMIENGVVTNIIVIDPDRYTGPAVPTGELPVAIGDTYDGEAFTRDGAKVTLPDPEAEYRAALEILGVEV